jgi:hypothetical protein
VDTIARQTRATAVAPNAKGGVCCTHRQNPPRVVPHTVGTNEASKLVLRLAVSADKYSSLVFNREVPRIAEEL